MSDNGNAESHTVRLLQEMRAGMDEFRQEMRAEMTEFRQEMTEFRQEMTEFRGQMTEFRQEMTEFRQVTERRLDSLEHRLDGVEQRLGGVEQRVGVLEPSVLKVIDAVTAIAKTQEQHTALLMAHSEKLTEIQRSQSVVEKDMRGLRGRVERVEDRVGLV